MPHIPAKPRRIGFFGLGGLVAPGTYPPGNHHSHPPTKKALFEDDVPFLRWDRLVSWKGIPVEPRISGMICRIYESDFGVFLQNPGYVLQNHSLRKS